MEDELTKYLHDRAPLSREAQAFLQEFDAGVGVVKAEFWVADDLFSTEPERFHFVTHAREWSLPWSERLTDEVWRRHIRMSTIQDESARCGMHLIGNLRLADTRFGQDYTNSVLVEVVRERFSHIAPIAEALDLAPTYAPYKSDNSYVACASYVRDCITGLGNSLVIEFGYEDRQAFSALAAAVWFVLDKRFSLSFLRAARPL